MFDRESNISVTSEVLQELDLAQRSLRKDLLAEHIGDLLDSYPLSSLAIGSSTSTVSAMLWRIFSATIPDNAICALTQLFCDGVSVINNEILVEDFEHLAPG
jgi:hypothetical protein